MEWETLFVAMLDLELSLYMEEYNITSGARLPSDCSDVFVKVRGWQTWCH